MTGTGGRVFEKLDFWVVPFHKTSIGCASAFDPFSAKTFRQAAHRNRQGGGSQAARLAEAGFFGL